MMYGYNLDMEFDVSRLVNLRSPNQFPDV